MQAETGPTAPADHEIRLDGPDAAAAETLAPPRARGKCGLCKTEHDHPDVRFHCASYAKFVDGRPAPIELCSLSIEDGRDFNRRGRLVHVSVFETSQRNSRRIRVCCEPTIAPSAVPAPDATPMDPPSPPHAPSNPAPAVDQVEASS